MSKNKTLKFFNTVGRIVKFAVLFIILFIVVRMGQRAFTDHLNEKALIRLYQGYRDLPEKPPTIFVPGMMASVLKDEETGEVVFGGVFQGLIPELELPIDGKTLQDDRDDLVASKPIAKFKWLPGILELDLHARVSEIAIKAGGFTVGVDGFSFPWDWRRDLFEAVQQLDQYIERIKKEKGQPDLKFNLLCHSAGGLVARYYAKYGAEDVLNDPNPVPTYAGAKNIEKIIMLGTPNAGSIESFMVVDGGLWLPTIGRATDEIIFSMPALYQMMPLEGRKVFIDPDGNPLDIDLYDPANWEKYGWSVFDPVQQEKKREDLRREHGEMEGEEQFQQLLNEQRRFLGLVMDRAQKFQKALWAGDPVQEKQKIRYVVFGGDRELTLRAAILDQDAHGKWKTEFKTNRPEVRDVLFAYGDKSVPKESLLGRHTVELDGQTVKRQLPLAYSVFIFSSHVQMTNNMTYLDNVLHVVFEEYDPKIARQKKRGLIQQILEWA